MSGTLFVVATPIGNLEDITFRALRVLREADVIAAEDTRRTGQLLSHYGITTSTLSFHRHNIRARLPQLVRRLEQGDDVAVVTDAGTPGISDPGIELVQACAAKGIGVEPVPGPSAPLTAAVASGFPLEPMTIFGFVPVKAKDREAWMARIQATQHTFVFFEAPHRIERTLAELGAVLGERQIVIGRELTKRHQEFLRGTASSLIGQVTSPRGEFTVVVGPAEVSGEPQILALPQRAAAEVGHVANISRSARGFAAEIARKYGRSTNEVYQIIERLKDSGV